MGWGLYIYITEENSVVSLEDPVMILILKITISILLIVHNSVHLEKRLGEFPFNANFNK